MESQYPSFNLQMLNLIIAMCRGNPDVPSLLADLGYTECWIELQFANSESEGVRPEIIIYSEDNGHTILWEWKSGGSLDQDQLRRYAAVTTEDIRERAYVPPGGCESLDVALVVPDSKTIDCTRILQEWGFTFPLIEKAKDGVSLVVNEFCVDELDAAMAAKLIIDFGQLPLHYVPFDSETPLWVYACRVGQKLIEYMHKGVPRVILHDLVSEVVPAWSVVSPKQRGEYRNKLRDTLDDMARHEFRVFLRRNRAIAARTGGPTWDILQHPLAKGTDKRTRVFKTMQKKLDECIGRVRMGQTSMDLD